MLRSAIDIGGTFTDLVFINDDTGEMTSYKTLTTPKDPSIGALNGINESNVDLREIWLLVHGTTIVINSIISHAGAMTGLIITQGFRDLLEIGRQNRTVSFDIFYKRPPPLVQRKWRIEVPERTDFLGKNVVELDLKEVQRALRYFIDEGIESVAVFFLHSYANSENEEKVEKLVKTEFQDLDISISSKVLPEIREYERLSTTVVNAYSKPIVKKYLDKLESNLQKQGYASDLYVMQSNGGLMTSALAKMFPVQIIESGPVGGIIAAKNIGNLIGCTNIAVFDMGGTTSKAGLISQGNVKVTTSYSPAGYPIRVPVVDMVELGIGGGSIAWVDDYGFLQVGPTSAGADPGPACYDLGGEEPTITDANLVLGRLSNLLEGKIQLNKEKAIKAIMEKIANPLKLDLIGAAGGIIEIAVAKVVDIMRMVSISKGIDIREYTIFGFGGAGPMHSAFITRELGVSTNVIPATPGAFSALGFLCSDLRHDFVRTYIMNTAASDPVKMEGIFCTLESKGIETLRGEGININDITTIRSTDMRYIGQAHEIDIPFPGERVTVSTTRKLQKVFHETYERHYGQCFLEKPAEIVNFRVTAVGKVRKPPIPKIPQKKRQPVLKELRHVYFKERGWIDCPIYGRSDLAYGSRIRGPAIIEEFTATTIIPPGFMSDIDEYGNILITNR